MPGLGFFDETAEAHLESDDSGGEDELDFWGRDEPRSVTSIENVDDNEEDDSDDDSVMDDCDEDEADEEDPLELFGHR
jgi:hypothetical protein